MKILSMLIVCCFPFISLAGGTGVGPGVVMAGYDSSESLAFEPNNNLGFVTIGGAGGRPGSSIVWNEKKWSTFEMDNSWLKPVVLEDILVNEYQIKVQFIEVKDDLIHYSVSRAGKRIVISSDEFEIKENKPALYQALVDSFDMGNEPVFLNQEVEL